MNDLGMIVSKSVNRFQTVRKGAVVYQGWGRDVVLGKEGDPQTSTQREKG